MDNKDIFASNLRRYMELNEKSRKDVSDAIGVSYYTFTDWINGKKFPRMDKVEKLANYFGILKSDLIEDKTEMKKNNDVMADIIVRMRTDKDFFEAVNIMYTLDDEKFSNIKNMLTFLK